MASSFGQRVLTTTQDELLPRVVDTILNSNVFLTRIMKATKKWSGEQMKFPIKYQKNTGGSSFFGYDSLGTGAADTRVRLVFDPKFYSIPVSLPLTDLAVNEVSEAKIIDLMAVEMESSAHDMADDLGTIFYSDGTGNSSKDHLGLAALVDDGTTVATYGELSRSTYGTLASTVTASGGTLTLAKMATLYNACSSGSQKTTVGLCPEAVFSLYEQLLTPQERISKDVSTMKGGLIGGTGYTGLFYKGFPVLADEKCTAQTLFFLNEDFIDFYALPFPMTEAVKYKTVIEGNDYGQPQGLGFSWSGWIKPINGASIVGHIYLGGQLIGRNPKRDGKLTGITGV